MNDYALKEKQESKRAFAITNDVRVVYEETVEANNILDTANYNQIHN